MAGEKLSLEVLIRTIAEGRGIPVTSEQIKQLAAEMESATEAGEALEVNADQIAKKLTEVGKGAKTAAPAVEGVANATKKAGDSQKAAAKNVNELGENFEKGAAAGRVMSAALQGNVSAIFQLAPAIKALGALMKTNLIGMLITIGALAAQVLVPLIKGFTDAKKSIEDTTKEAEALAKVKMDTLARELKVAGDAADAARTKFADAQAAAERLDNAEQAAQLAEVRANPKLNDAQKSAAESQVRKNFRTRGQARALDAKQFASDEAVTAERAARDAAARPDQDLKAEIQTLNRLQAKQSAREDALLELVKLQTQYNAQLQENNEGRGRLGDTQATAESIRAIARELNGGKFADRTADIAAQKERVTAALGPSNAAQTELVKRERATTAARNAVERERGLQAEENKFFDREQGATFSREIDASAKAIALGTKSIADILTKSAEEVQKANAARKTSGGTIQLEGGEIRRVGAPVKGPGSITGPDGVSRPIAAMPAANTGSSIARVADAIATTPTPEPLDMTPIATGFAAYVRQTAVNQQQSNAAIVALQKQLGEATRQIATLQLGQRSLAENKK